MTIEEIKRMVAGEQYSFLRTNPQIIGGTTKFSNEEIVVKQFMSYERLLKIAKKMHTWIFLHCFDEEEVYESLGITEDENAILGYGGGLKLKIDPQEDGGRSSDENEET